MIPNFIQRFAFALALIFLPSIASALTVTFDSLKSDFSSGIGRNYLEQEFVFASIRGGSLYRWSPDFPGFNADANGAAIFDSGGDLLIAASSNANFNLNSMDFSDTDKGARGQTFAIRFGSDEFADQIKITLDNIPGSQTVSLNISNIDFVWISSLRASGFYPTPQIDNVVLNFASPVPEAASWLKMFVGLAFVIWFSNKRYYHAKSLRILRKGIP